MCRRMKETARQSGGEAQRMCLTASTASHEGAGRPIGPLLDARIPFMSNTMADHEI